MRAWIGWAIAATLIVSLAGCGKPTPDNPASYAPFCATALKQAQAAMGDSVRGWTLGGGAPSVAPRTDPVMVSCPIGAGFGRGAVSFHVLCSDAQDPRCVKLTSVEKGGVTTTPPTLDDATIRALTNKADSLALAPLPPKQVAGSPDAASTASRLTASAGMVSVQALAEQEGFSDGQAVVCASAPGGAAPTMVCKWALKESGADAWVQFFSYDHSLDFAPLNASLGASFSRNNRYPDLQHDEPLVEGTHAPTGADTTSVTPGACHQIVTGSPQPVRCIFLLTPNTLMETTSVPSAPAAGVDAAKAGADHARDLASLGQLVFEQAAPR